jgi:hypothetical protein
MITHRDHIRDGRMKTAKIDQGMLRHDILAKMLLLQMRREGVSQGPTT